MDNQALLKAIGECGSQAELARRIGVSTPQVNEWTKGQRPIPPTRCERIERATGGAVTCEELRPDLMWTRDQDGNAFYRERIEDLSDRQPQARAA
ncbi:MAG: helix-turn-helix domain-containing protein [Planctomycetales bacterium]|nr:helix-turn-helix domain-containing protein [Planctomycetales bacterium]